MEFGDFAAWWVCITPLQLSWSFPFGKPPKILIFPAFLSSVQRQELEFPAPGSGILPGGGIWRLEFTEVMLRGGKNTSPEFKPARSSPRGGHPWGGAVGGVPVLSPRCLGRVSGEGVGDGGGGGAFGSAAELWERAQENTRGFLCSAQTLWCL